MLVISGLLSIALELAFGNGEHGWVEGTAILAAVAVVALVTALNNYEKEKQFRDLSALSNESEVSSRAPVFLHATVMLQRAVRGRPQLCFTLLHQSCAAC